MARLTQIRTGNGDTGFSNLVSGLKIRKSNDICGLQNYIQLFNIELKSFVFDSEAYKKLPDSHHLFLEYLYSSFCNSFSASVYFNFETENYTLPKERVLYLETLITLLGDQVEDAQEFVVVEKDLLSLERTMIYIRQIEHYFWRMLDMNNYYFIADDVKKIRESNTLNFSRFLNALSDYFFLLIRFLSSETQYWTKTI